MQTTLPSDRTDPVSFENLASNSRRWVDRSISRGPAVADSSCRATLICWQWLSRLTDSRRNDLLMGMLRLSGRHPAVTLAGRWHTANTGKFVAKDTAASWAILRLSGQRARTLGYARRAYLGEVTDDWTSQSDAAQKLAEHMGEQVTLSL